MKKLIAAGAAVLLAGCVTTQPPVWIRADGQRSRDNPVLAQQFEMDKAICLGELQKANLSGVTFTGGGIAGVAASVERAQAAGAVGVGCMASKGYVQAPADQAEAKAEELREIAEMKRKQEAAAAAPPAPPNRGKKPLTQ